MLLAVVPAFNEEASIASVVRDLSDHVDLVVVIDDGSDDSTASLAQRAGAIVLRHVMNRGQGAALETGHAYARSIGADHILHFDADGQFDPRDILPALLQLRRSGADVLFGTRFLDTRSNIPWFKRHILLPLGRIVDRLFGGLSLTDVHNGFRILTKDALAKIAITHDRMAHATDIEICVKRAGLRYIEHPVRVVYREYGLGAKGGVEIVKDLVVGRFLSLSSRAKRGIFRN